ncbi:MAG: SAM-dependent methyltransferase [Burkholderiaceae bacterium]|nr:SAM-dependent methyltransferase [Burkholderiaceae bacterium]MCD8564397.1 SAM-dependent methyltransferase [Burkholderiaceae bacterium]
MSTHEILPGQSEALLKALHILTRDGKLNQDSRRKLKQVNHLFQFIQPALQELQQVNPDFTIVDHGAGKSYLGFMLVDLYLKDHAPQASVIGIERRHDLVTRAEQLAQDTGFAQMRFLALDARDAIASTALPDHVDMVTALHACDTATDDAIAFGLAKKANYMILVPCCQAEVAAALRQAKRPYDDDPLSELWRRPIHTREFGSHLTNTLRCLQLEAHGYQVTVTELVGWEHAIKNELIIAKRKGKPQSKPALKLRQMLDRVGLPALADRFFLPDELKRTQEVNS